MAMEAANLLLAIQQNPNAPDREQLKSRANKLLQSPLVHERVTQYFQQMHKKIWMWFIYNYLINFPRQKPIIK